MSPADWELWRHAGMVTLKQAVFLTMNLEPIGGCIDDDAISKEYHKRFSIASSWRDELPHTEGINSAASYWRVNLKQFGFIAQSRGWVLPDEFPVSDEPPQYAPALVEESPSKPETRQTEINRWLRDTWETEGRPGGAAFFRKLKGYKRKPGSPILEWYQAGKDAGIEYETSAGARGELSIHTIQNKVSEWRNLAAPSNP